MNGDNNRGGIRLLPIIIGLLAVGFVAVRGCQEGPFGRKQIVALNPQQEARLGVQAFNEVLSRSDVIEGGPTVEAVRGVIDRLTRATSDEQFLRLTGQKRQDLKWEVRVVRSNEVNAFCLPGGKIVVYTAILPVAETDAGLATVLGHEISHALAHHGAERMAQQEIAQIGVTAAAGSLNDVDPTRRAEIMQALNAGAQFGILKYSRKHESEADHMGLLLMATAGYNPADAVKFWERMKHMSGGGKTPEFLSTHPSHETRIRDLTNWIPEALPLYEAHEGPSAKKLPLGKRRE
jgi:predicted Zn-dependent protease